MSAKPRHADRRGQGAVIYLFRPPFTLKIKSHPKQNDLVKVMGPSRAFTIHGDFKPLWSLMDKILKSWENGMLFVFVGAA